MTIKLYLRTWLLLVNKVIGLIVYKNVCLFSTCGMQNPKYSTVSITTLRKINYINSVIILKADRAKP